MPQLTDMQRHEVCLKRSQNLLEAAREQASKKREYDTEMARITMSNRFYEQFQSNPYPWQLDVAETMLTGLDSIVIAGTGAGKTIPFMLPLLLEEKKITLVISLLKILQKEQVDGYDYSKLKIPLTTLQVARFEKATIPALAVNSETWSTKTHKVRKLRKMILKQKDMYTYNIIRA